MTKTQPKAHLKIVGLDPSFRNWGVAVCSLSSDFHLTVDKVHTIATVADPSIKLKSMDDINCANALYFELRELLDQADVVVAEVPTGSQTASGMKGHGICLGLLGMIQSHHHLVQVSPYDIKNLLGGSATKQQVIAYVHNLHPEALPKDKRTGQPLMKGEHVADAIASIYAAARTPEFKTFIQSLLGN